MGLGGSSADAIAVVVLNHDGLAHLTVCLEAALRLDGLAGPRSVVVADNGSTDGSLDHLAGAFPAVRVLRFGENLGFAAGNNRAAALIAADYLLFLNNDTRVRTDALAALWPAVESGAACAGARLVDWEGRRVDFDGGGASFSGHGHALGYGRPVPRAPAPPRPTLFASGAAMLVHRATFLAVGGFDPEYFAYYEDVDLGWRLWLAGHEVQHVPAAVVHHRHHGTAGRLAAGLQARLYERNALATVAKNYSDANLPRALPAALVLAAFRAGAPASAELVAGAVPGAGPAPAEAGGLPVPPARWVGWPALEPLGLDFRSLAEARARVQALRRLPDTAILPRLVHPFAPVPPTRSSRDTLHMAVEQFGLEAIFGPWPGPGHTPSPWRRWPRQAWAALRAGGPAGLAAEIRAYRAWRRGSGAG